MRFNLLILAALLLAGYGLTLLPDFPPAQKTAPQFSFRTLDAKTHKLGDFQGKTVIVNFWASWCPPCVKEFPLLIAAAKKHEGKVVLIALSSDIDDKAIENFLKRQKIDTKTSNILIGRDENDISGKLFQTFKLPETYVIGPSQRIQAKFVGAGWQPEDLENIINSL